MSAVILPLVERAPRRPAPAAEIAARGYFVVYRPGEANHCPGCGRSHWWIGVASAECAFCGTALPFASPARALLAGKDL